MNIKLIELSLAGPLARNRCCQSRPERRCLDVSFRAAMRSRFLVGSASSQQRQEAYFRRGSVAGQGQLSATLGKLR
jgi:hypothetical protein